MEDLFKSNIQRLRTLSRLFHYVVASFASLESGFTQLLPLVGSCNTLESLAVGLTRCLFARAGQAC